MNNKITKVGLLVFILAVPAFLFIVAHLTGENHFDLPRLFPKDVETRIVDGIEVTDTVYHKIGPFEFIDENGATFSSDYLKGKLVVASFIFTNCKKECSVITSQLGKVNQVYKDDPNVVILSFTVDPDFDTPKVLSEYKSNYEISNPNWKFLSGRDKDYTYEILQKHFYAVAGVDPDESIGFIHSQRVVLIDEEGVIREYYEGVNPDSIDELINGIEILKDVSK